MMNKKAIWVKSSDMKNIDFKKLKNNQIDTIFLHEQSINLYGEKTVQEFIKNAKNKQIDTHIWTPILRTNQWENPIKNGKLNEEILEKNLKKVNEISKIPGIIGVQLDYIRYPGNANEYENSTEAITLLVKKLSEEIKKVNKTLIITGTLMPEPYTTAYGQNPRQLSKYLDAIIPMVYKGNYNKNSKWINETLQWYTKNILESKIWAGLETYTSDKNPTPLSLDELNQDINKAINTGIEKVALFRYGLTQYEVKMENQIDLTYSEDKLSKKEFKTIEERVNKYTQAGGQIKQDRNIYLEYPSLRKYIKFWRYLEMLTRWNNFIKNNKHEPNYIYIKTPATDISGDDKIIPINTFLDMENRVNNYLKNGGEITDTRRIYLKIDEQLEYITYNKYKDLLERCNTWRKQKAKNPNFLYIITQSNTNQARPDAVGNNITPNNEGWYLSQRYKSNSSAIKQENNHYCGPNAVQQLFYEITGKWYSESKIAQIAGTTTNGTDHQGITKAIQELANENNLKVNIEWKYFTDIGYEKLGKIIKDITQGSLQHLHYKGKYGHYEEILGVNNKTGKLLIANSLSGGWLEYRTQKTNTLWLNGINQPSICVVKVN